MKLLALLAIGMTSLGGLECIAESFRQQGFEATVSNQEIWIEAKKPVNDKQLGGLHGLKYISSIRLLDGGFTDKGVAQFKQLDGLTTLVLKSNDLTDEATVPISKLTTLTKLDLMGAKLTWAGLVRLGRLPNLKQLYLHSANLQAKDLASLKNFKGLRTLTLPDNLGPAVLAEMKRALPNADVTAPREG